MASKSPTGKKKVHLLMKTDNSDEEEEAKAVYAETPEFE